MENKIIKITLRDKIIGKVFSLIPDWMPESIVLFWGCPGEGFFASM